MRCRLNTEEENDGAFPVLSDASSVKRRKSGKFVSCAFNAFKCSSRAERDCLCDNHHVTAELDDDNDDDDASDERLCPTSGNLDGLKDEEQADTSSHEDLFSPPESSEETHNTRFDVSLPSPDDQLVLCQHGCLPLHHVPVLHSAGFIADSNAPSDSHVFEDDDSGTGPNQTVDAEDVRQILRLPYTLPHTNATPSVASVASASSNGTTPYFHRQTSMHSMDSTKSLLFGEQFSIAASFPPVSQNREEIQLLVVATQAFDSETVRMASEGSNNSIKEVRPPLPQSPVPPPATAMRIPSNEISCSGSSFSSVSSFLEGTGDVQKPEQLENYRIQNNNNTSPSATTPPPPRPFFWRSHPNVTVTSYDFQQQQPQQLKQKKRLHQRKSKMVISELQTVDDDAAIDSICSVSYLNSSFAGVGRTGTTCGGNGGSRFSLDEKISSSNNRTSSSYAPYVHEAIVQKIWRDSKTIQLKINSTWQNLRKDSQQQGPTRPLSSSSRSSSPSFQSLASGFANIQTTAFQSSRK